MSNPDQAPGETPADTPPALKEKRRAMTLGTWLAVAGFGAILGAVIWYSVHAWYSVPDQMTSTGYFAMILGVVFSVGLGAGLMALVFWSHRRGYDR